MRASLTATLGGGFGSAVMIKGTGILITNGTYWFDPRPGRPNSIAPGKRVLWAGAPTIVLRGGEPFLVCGAPGGRKIMSAVVQTVVNAVDYGDGPQTATSRPRIHDEGEKLQVDSRIPEDVRSALAAMGHEPAAKAAPRATPASIEAPASAAMTAFLMSISCLLSFAPLIGLISPCVLTGTSA